MDISSIRDRQSSGPMSVSELNLYVKNVFDNDRTLRAVSVSGEISNLTMHRSGHVYFTLKDQDGQIKAVMFRSAAATLKFIPENGMRVTVRASVSVYVQGGSYQLYVNSMQPDGVGALYVAYEALKAKLYAEGLFDERFKRSLPRFPVKIGVITSPTGAAIRDIINVLGRRFPTASIYLYPALVQGEGAEQSLIDGLEYFDSSGLVDLIIIGRGGGSIEDLWAFNSERLARRIFSLSVPIISAVGHETDFTICDFVSDKRAPTPSAAAEIAVPDERELLLMLDSAHERALAAVNSKISSASMLLDFNIRHSGILEGRIFDDLEDRLQDAVRDIASAMDTRLESTDTALRVAAAKLDGLSPLAVLKRGYSVVSSENGVITDVSQASVGDILRIRLFKGEITAEIKERSSFDE